MKNLIIATATIVALSVPAFAGSCPTLVKKIDEALATAQISDADKAKVMELRNKGEQQHGSGKHGESVATLNEALKMLGM